MSHDDPVTEARALLAEFLAGDTSAIVRFPRLLGIIADECERLREDVAILRSTTCAVHPDQPIVPACLQCWRDQSAILERIVKSAHRAANLDGSITPRDWIYQLVPTDLIEEAEAALRTPEKP